MAPTNPRIIVSSATFDLEESTASKKQDSVGRISTIDSDDSTYPRQLAAISPVEHSQEQSWAQSTLSWAPELIWCLLSIVLLMGLVMVLSNFDGKPLPNLPLGLTLNTIIAILTTASRAVTVFLIGQGISQMKWNQYVGVEKPLRNLSIFDEASRGPWGSLKMVFTTRGGFLAFMASFLVITSLASSTLTQSAITYTPRLVAEDTLSAKAQYCDAYPCGKSFEAGPDALNEFTNSLETAAFGAVFNNVERNWPILEPQCQSADCKWSDINSLAVCYEIRNITDKLDVNATVEGSGLMATRVNKASLMNGTAYLLEVEDVTMGSYSYAVNISALNPDFFLIPQGKADLTFPFPRNTIAFGGDDDKNRLDTAFSQLLMIYSNLMTDYENPSTRYRAVEVLMHFCVRTLEVEVKQGQSSTKSVKSHTSITDVKASTVEIDGGGETGYFELSSPDGNNTFRLIESADYGQLDEDFDRAFSGYYSARVREKAQPGEMTRQIGLNMFRALQRDTPAEEADGKVIKNLERVLDTIATSMTNYMREVGKESAGTAFTSVTFVQVRWEWLTLVAAQVVLSIAFLLTVVVGTARLGVDVVKSTNTAELFAIPSHGYGVGCKDDEATRSQEVEISGGIKTEVGKGVEATLMKGAEGWQLRIRHQKPDL